MLEFIGWAAVVVLALVAVVFGVVLYQLIFDKRLK